MNPAPPVTRSFFGERLMLKVLKNCYLRALWQFHSSSRNLVVHNSITILKLWNRVRGPSDHGIPRWPC